MKLPISILVCLSVCVAAPRAAAQTLSLPSAAPLPSTYTTPSPHFDVGFKAHAETAWPPTSFKRPPDDPWLAFDKVQHVAFSFLWTLGTQYVLVNKGDWRERRALPFSAGSAGLVGLGKEWYDLRRKPHGRFSHRDLVADAVGIACAVGLIIL